MTANHHVAASRRLSSTAIAWALLISLALGSPALAQEATDKTSGSLSVQLVCEARLAEQLADHVPAGFELLSIGDLVPEELVAKAAAGQSVVWIGPPEKIPSEFWIGSHRPSEAAMQVVTTKHGPLSLGELPVINAKAWGAYIHPPTKFPKHNIVEEPRAEFQPILEAVDRFGKQVAYPGVLFEHTAGSLALDRFARSRCYFFLFEEPAEAMGTPAWVSLLQKIANKNDSRLHVRSCRPNYASYQPGERAQLEVRVRNSRAAGAAFEVRFSVQKPGSDEYTPITTLRRVAPANDETEVVCDYLVPQETGVCHILVEVLQDREQTEQLAVLGNPTVIDTRKTAFIVAPKPLRTPQVMSIAGPNFRFGDTDLFCIGTHYYPSSSWWEWAWRDFSVAIADRDFRAMRENGNRIVRVWVDPVLDETVLRSMDAAIAIAAEHGVVLDFCLFNQWTRDLGFERPSGEQVTFEFRHRNDFNLYSLSLRNLALQREYVSVLAERWKGVGNILYNLANESYVKDPDASQMDDEAIAWEGIPEENGELRDTLLFRKWADAVSEPIRKAGGNQATFGGYLFSLDSGGDTYLANADAPLMTWHCYAPPRKVASMLQYFDAVGSNRPTLLEEFGTAGDDPETHYDLAAHYALAGGAAAAMSYEWGVSRMAQESSFVATPLRDCIVDNPDPRWFKPVVSYAPAETAPNGVGLATFPSGFGYGSIYHGTPFPAPSAVHLGRVGIMGGRLTRSNAAEQAYVIVPQAATEKAAEYLPFFERLWKEGVEFGVCQEVDLARLPTETPTLLCPGELSPESEQLLKERQEAGAQVFRGYGEEWLQAKVLPRAVIYPSGAAEVVVRRTTTGVLYAIFPLGDERQVELQAGGRRVSLALDKAGLVHVGKNGVDLIEATGAVTIDGQPLATIEGGRAILSAEDGADLTKSSAVSVMVTAPTNLEFNRKIATVDVYEEGQSKPIGTIVKRQDDESVQIDSDCARYRVRVAFGDD